MLTLMPPLRCIVALARERILVGQGRWFASPHPPMIGEATTSACGTLFGHADLPDRCLLSGAKLTRDRTTTPNSRVHVLV